MGALFLISPISARCNFVDNEKRLSDMNFSIIKSVFDQTERVALVRSARVQLCWRPCTRSCTWTASPWWAWAETTTKWRTGAAEAEEGASSSPLRYGTLPRWGGAPLICNSACMVTDKTLQDAFYVFLHPPPLGLGFWVFKRDKTKAQTNVGYPRGPVLWYLTLSVSLDCWVFAWWRVLVCMLGAPLLRLQSAPSMTIRVAERTSQPLPRHGDGSRVCVMNDLMTPN